MLAVTGREVGYSQLSYRDTDTSMAGPNFHPLVQQKRLTTGQKEDDWPQLVGWLGGEAGARAWQGGWEGAGHAVGEASRKL